MKKRRVITADTIRRVFGQDVVSQFNEAKADTDDILVQEQRLHYKEMRKLDREIPTSGGKTRGTVLTS